MKKKKESRKAKRDGKSSMIEGFKEKQYQVSRSCDFMTFPKRFVSEKVDKQ